MRLLLDKAGEGLRPEFQLAAEHSLRVVARNLVDVGEVENCGFGVFRTA
jgi:hypothetical protein